MKPRQNAVDAEYDIIESSAAPAVITAMVKGEVDIQIATARAYPRSMEKVIAEAIELATMSEEVAEDCLYALKRTDKNGDENTIEGGSVRLAEILVYCMGNCFAGSRSIGEDEHFTTSQGFFFDMERNNKVVTETRRRITTSKGKRYGSDMIGVTSNAAASIAYRNAVFRGVPRALWNTVYLKAREKAIGDPQRLVDTRKKTLLYFQKVGATEAQVLKLIGVETVEEITLDHIGFLRGIAASLRNGEQSFDQVFGKNDAGQEEKAEESNAKLAALREEEAKEASATKPTEPESEKNADPEADAKVAEAANERLKKNRETAKQTKQPRAETIDVWGYQLQSGPLAGSRLGDIKADLADVTKEAEFLTAQDRKMVDAALAELNPMEA